MPGQKAEATNWSGGGGRTNEKTNRRTDRRKERRMGGGHLKGGHMHKIGLLEMADMNLDDSIWITLLCASQPASSKPPTKAATVTKIAQLGEQPLPSPLLARPT